MEGEDDNPEVLGVRKFVAARIDEIKALTLQLAGNSSSDQNFTFQHVPKHMRRRAVSHNVKRLPKRLRAAHLADVAKNLQNNKSKGKTGKGGEDEGGDADDSKPKKSRKFRRKPSNLLGEYNRRQKQIKWLETHIWHAKRFHMEKKWNHKIPIRPSEKGFRPIYRSFAEGTTMRDISFYSCLQISGKFSVICEKFKKFTHQNVNLLSIGATFYQGGLHEGQLHFYEKGAYPFGYIGPISFFWKPDLSAIWLWVHPAYKEAVVSEIISQFELNVDPSSTLPGSSTVLSRDETKLEAKHIGSHKIWKNSADGIEMIDLEGALNRIRLVGRDTLALLSQFLKTRSSFNFSDTNEKSRQLKWFEKFFAKNEEIIEDQAYLLKSFTPNIGIPTSAVVPIVVRDPRAFLPQKREAMKKLSSIPQPDNSFEEDNPHSYTLLNHYLKNCPPSPLWSEELREAVRLEKMSDSELSKRRGEMLIPGSEIDLGVEENQIPILLICQNDGRGGIDLILPAGWAMPFWIGLSYRCVLAHGLRDAIHFAYEDGNLCSPDLMPPDSKCGLQEFKDLEENSMNDYFKQAPNKRPNLHQLASPAPFSIDWELLLSKWDPSRRDVMVQARNPQTPDFYVLRDKEILETLRSIVNRGKPVDGIPISDSGKCLVAVRVFMHRKGHPGKDSVICIPNSTDVETLDAIKSFDYSEPPAKDPSAKKREELRTNHSKFMTYLKKKRKKNRGKESASVYDSTEASRLYNQQLRELYTPDCSKALDSSTRAVFGFLTIGGECYSIGKCAYLGYVTFHGLMECIKQFKLSKDFNHLPRGGLHVLVRDTRSTLKYRLARLEIINPF